MVQITKLRQELRYAYEGLEQMQQPDAGYFDDPEHKDPSEIAKYNQDVNAQCVAIERLERKIANYEKEATDVA